jgi:hypothetical protein
VTFDYATLPADVESGAFRTRLQDELTIGFRQIHESGERLPTASHYAAQIAEIVSRNAEAPLGAELAFEVYQEILTACEQARDAVIGEPSS